MTDGSQQLRQVAWRQVFPWLIIFRSFRLSISMPALFLATIGALLTPAGWMLSGVLFIGDQPAVAELAEIVAANSRWPDRVGSPPPDLFGDGGVSWHNGWNVLTSVPRTYLRFVEPFARSAGGSGVSVVAYFLFGGIWNLAVWALLGGSITRLAAVRLGREEQLGLRQAVRHAVKNYVWYFAAPFFPLFGVVLIAIPVAILGLCMRLSIGALLAVLIWPFVLIGAFLMAILVVGVACGWPLMWPTISSEESSDAFEAFSRSFSYTYQRPLHYLGLAVVAVLFGGACWLVVAEFSSAVIRLAEWSARWGTGAARWEQLLAAESGLDWFAARLLRLISGIVSTIAAGFQYSFFFCAATAIYLVLRRQVDQTEFDEVFGDEDEQRYGLLEVGSSGVTDEPSGG